jgi:ATP-dependent Zn protease
MTDTVDPAPEGLAPPGEPPHAPPRPTRQPMVLWDRIRLLLLFAVAWLVIVWAAMADNPLLPFVDAVRIELVDSRWLLWLAAAEALRQVHFLISERSAGYHAFWTEGVFGGTERFLSRRLSDWTRLRLGRLLKVLAFVALFALVAAHILGTTPLLALFEVPAMVVAALPWMLQLAFAFVVIGLPFVGLLWLLSRGGIDTFYPDDISTRFSDVWGQDHVLGQVRENIMFLEHPDEIERKGGYVPGGILLWGPSGTGKTLLAEAVAGETGKPFVLVEPGAFGTALAGAGILKVKSLFRKLRKLALRYGGVIVFFDEADALGNRGMLAEVGPSSVHTIASPAPFAAAGCHGPGYLSDATRWLLARSALGDTPEAPDDGRHQPCTGMGRDGGTSTLQALLAELSGLTKPRGLVNRWGRRALGMPPKPPPKYRVLVMMATNKPESLAEALLRPGRIDRVYRVGYPTRSGRIRTYQGYFAKVRHAVTPEEIDKLATITPHATGATIKDLVNESLIMAVRAGREVITWRDVIRAKQLKDLGPPQDVDYVERERHALAVHEACHAVVAFRTRRHMEIDVATIEKGSGYLGMVASIAPQDQINRWRSEFEADILVSLASLAGERMFFDGDSSRGVCGDLDSATTLASLMEGHWGMGSTVSSYSAARRLQIGTPGGQGVEREEVVRRRALADRIEDRLAVLLATSEAVLRDNRTTVLAVAHALETHKTLSGEDVRAVMDGIEGPLVDGRLYADPAFVAQLEAYHDAVVGAHRGHTGIGLALPGGGRRMRPRTDGGTAAAVPSASK